MAGIAANIALVVAGSYMKWVNATLTGGSLLLSLRYLVATVLVLSGVMMSAKLYVDGNIKSVDVRPIRTASAAWVLIANTVVHHVCMHL